jgi:hypothetical protein
LIPLDLAVVYMCADSLAPHLAEIAGRRHVPVTRSQYIRQ